MSVIWTALPIALSWLWLESKGPRRGAPASARMHANLVSSMNRKPGCAIQRQGLLGTPNTLPPAGIEGALRPSPSSLHLGLMRRAKEPNGASQVVEWERNRLLMQETQEMRFRSLYQEDPLVQDFQDSCLKNSMDRRTWWGTVHGVANSRT